MAGCRMSNESSSSMSERNEERLKERPENKELVKRTRLALETFDEEEENKLQQWMHVLPVGHIPALRQNHDSKLFNDEKVEKYLEGTKLYERQRSRLLDKSKNFSVTENNFGPIIKRQLLKKQAQPTFENLQRACTVWDEVSEKHKEKSLKTYHYFTKIGVSKDDAKAYAMAIAFYSGSYSALASTAANYFFRQEEAAEKDWDRPSEDISAAATILYFLLSGLSHIRFYWGVVTRYIDLTEHDLKDYRPGEVLTLLQFSSATKGGDDMGTFARRNTVLKIVSLTGRPIKNFSHYGSDEDEVLFLPHSSFLICSINESKPQREIFMRQIEVGLAEYVILWVDDDIFDETLNIKELVEVATKEATKKNRNISFILKSSTDSALSFLRSKFGQRIRDKTSFRIVTDMRRPHEVKSHFAGAFFLKQVRELGFEQSCLIYTRDDKSYEKLQQVFGTYPIKDIKVTIDPSKLEKFIRFEHS